MTIQCPGCNFENPDDTIYCGEGGFIYVYEKIAL